MDVLADATLFDVAAIELALERVFGVSVHVVASGGLRGALGERALVQAEPL